MSSLLIIDDQAQELAALQAALGQERFDYVVAANGREARAVLERSPGQIDAILLDWELPDVDEVEFLEWVGEHPELADIEVVIESAVMVPDRIRAGIDRGAYYYLTKPYEDAQLQAIVTAAVESCRLKRSLAEKVNQANDVLRLLDRGTFLVRTIPEAEALAVRLAASCDDPDKGVALFELLVNAVEHGNLGITYRDKSRLLEAGTLREEIRRRLELPENRDKRVVVDLRREPDRIRLRIEDCGRGFDYRKYMKVDPERLFDAHGRGIMLADSALELEYVDPGNQVRVSVGFAEPGSPGEPAS